MAAVPSLPTNFYVQTANQQNYVSWDLIAGATSYSVGRSTDGVTYTIVATPSVNYYLDTAVTTGTTYYYQVAGVNATGTGLYTTPQSVVPTVSGEMSLGQIRLLAQQRADQVNSNFVTVPEWNSYINQSLFELYDLLIDEYEDYFLATPVTFTTDGSTYLYDLPNGVNFTGAAPFYKLLGVDLQLNNASNAWVSIGKFNFIDRNRFVYPNTASTIYGVFNLQYRTVGTKLFFIPTPSSNQTIRIWYIPRLTQLLKDTDTTTAGISGWIEYVIVDAAMKCLQKQEQPVDVLMAQKMALKARIEESAANRDAGRPDTISDTSQNYFGMNGPFNGFKGGW